MERRERKNGVDGERKPESQMMIRARGPFGPGGRGQATMIEAQADG